MMVRDMLHLYLKAALFTRIPGDWLHRPRRCLSRYCSRRQAYRSGVLAVAVEVFVNDAG